MTIHHFINGYSLKGGGAERIVRSLHAGLLTRGIHSHVFGLLPVSDVDSMSNTFSLGVKSPYGWTAFNGIRHYIAENVKEGDVVHAHLFPTNFYLSLLKVIGVIKCQLVSTEHSTSNRRREKVYGHLIDAITYLGYDRVVAISKGAEKELLAWKPRLREKVTVVQNGVEMHFERVIRREKKEKLVVLSVGRICEAKNYANALNALSLLKDIEFEYQIAGVGEGLPELEQLAGALGISSKVHFLGYVEDIGSLLTKADVFLMPSLWEGFGLAAVEAMNASLPVVASDIPGLREVVMHVPACAVLVDPERPESIADALCDLLESYQKRTDLGDSAFKHSHQFSEDRMVESYMKVYAEILGTAA